MSLFYLHIMKLKDARKEKKIMDVTIDIVHTKGLSGFKMSELAKRVKISPSNLYIYFKNKEDLLLSVFFDTTKKIVKHLNESISNHPIYKKRIECVFYSIIQTKINKVKEFSFIEQFVHSSYFGEKHIQQMDLILKDVFDVFRDGQKEMILKDDVEIELIFALIDGATSKLVESHNKGKIKLDEKNLDKSFRMIWDAIRQ